MLMNGLIFGQAEHTGNVSLKDFDRVPKLADAIIFEIFQLDDFGAFGAMAFPAKHVFVGGEVGEVGEVCYPQDFDFPNDAPILISKSFRAGAADFDEMRNAGFLAFWREFLDE